jgi:uncharacterized protein
MIHSFNDFFPQGLASGKNFCNRISERTRLKENIHSARATLIMSPRRYGKTSLMLFVLQEMKLPFSHIDLYSEINEAEIQNTVLNAIGDVLYAVESTPKKALKFVTDFFSDLSVNFKLVNTQIRIEFSRSKKSPAKTILDALKKLDSILKTKKKKVVLFFDEFQRIGQITESSAIEGALRHVAQESKNIVFIFSGSNRHLLSKMFDDRTKPLYKLCDRIVLERITEENYLPFIQTKSKEKWGTPISEEAVTSILSLTEKHPYYVNVLCHRLWLLPHVPTENEVESTWDKYAIEERTNIMNEIDSLSHNQSKMLIAMAKYDNDILPMSEEFISLTRFSLSSASQSLGILEKKDYIQHNGKNKEGKKSKYFIVDPLIKYIFSQ